MRRRQTDAWSINLSTVSSAWLELARILGRNFSLPRLVMPGIETGTFRLQSWRGRGAFSFFLFRLAIAQGVLLKQAESQQVRLTSVLELLYLLNSSLLSSC